MNTLYYGDNLTILRDYVKDESVDLIYLDPPFNSKADYNLLFKEPTGVVSEAQITAFEDTWHWTDQTEDTFQKIIKVAPAKVVEMMSAFKQFIGLNDVMAYLTMMCIRLIEMRRTLKNTGSIYLHCDPTTSHYLKILMDSIFGKKYFVNEVIWAYRTQGATKRHWSRKHDVLLFYSKTDKYNFNYQTERSYMQHKYGFDKEDFKLDEEGKQYRDALIRDVWEISAIQSATRERLGYPTQKPEALISRIINASSNKGDVVMDTFCGCGTSIAVAQKLDRHWIGIDITHLAINLIKWRLKEMFNLLPKKDYKVIGEPEDLTGAKELAATNRYQFQWWALALIDARPYGDKKKGSDTGIDGYMYFSDEKDKVKKIIIQVKSGHVGVKDIRDLGHVIDREKAEIGIFITLESTTEPMRKEAILKGYYTSKLTQKDYPKIQILTIEELLNGNKPNTPLAIGVHKKAEQSFTQGNLL